MTEYIICYLTHPQDRTPLIYFLFFASHLSQITYTDPGSNAAAIRTSSHGADRGCGHRRALGSCCAAPRRPQCGSMSCFPLPCLHPSPHPLRCVRRGGTLNCAVVRAVEVCERDWGRRASRPQCVPGDGVVWLLGGTPRRCAVPICVYMSLSGRRGMAVEGVWCRWRCWALMARCCIRLIIRLLRRRTAL